MQKSADFRRANRTSPRSVPNVELARPFEWAILALILANAVAFILETVEPLQQQYSAYFRAFEIVSITVFAVEYVARLALVTRQNPDWAPGTARFRYALTWPALVDFAAVAPALLPMLLPDLRVVRMLRLTRVFRLLKLARYTTAVTRLQRTVADKGADLMLALTLVTILLVLSSSCMYWLEREVQPEVFGSIPAAMWWGVATLTTVGYGDAYPITPAGKVFGALTAMLCVGLFALPAGILASGFASADAGTASGRRCPECGRPKN